MIEHIASSYIGLLLLALVVAVVTEKIWKVPYTIALVLVGLAVGLLGVGPHPEELGLGHDLVFFVLLPPLLFQGALHMELNTLLKHIWPIFFFSIVGVLISTVVIGGMLYLVGGMGSLLVALLLGALLSPTDPVSVLALFKKAGVSADLRHLVEGESLFNDGTAVVVFVILLDLVNSGGEVGVGSALLDFVRVAGGGLVLGVGLGFIAWLFLRRVEEAMIETTACLTLALGSFWAAEMLHLSGVISTVSAGLLIGNYGKHLSMSSRAKVVIENFFEVLDFLINSVLFIMIGLEIQVVESGATMASAQLVGTGILALLVARAVVVYPLYHSLNLVGRVRPASWAHVLFWGGLRGSIPIALLLGLPREGAIAPYRDALLIAGFGVVLFSLVVQGLTVNPLLGWLGLRGQGGDRPAPS